MSLPSEFKADFEQRVDLIGDLMAQLTRELAGLRGLVASGSKAKGATQVTVYRDSDTRYWCVRDPSTVGPIGFLTQASAMSEARKILARLGGGELVVMGEDGKIRSKDTIGGGNESDTIDTEH